MSLGSFKPELADYGNKLHQSNESKSEERSTSESTDHESAKESYRKKKKEKHKHKKKKKKKSILTYSERESPVKKMTKEISFPGNKVFIEEIQGLDFKDAYRLDRKSDKNTWHYGSLYIGHVAKYRDNVEYCVGMIEDNKVRMKESRHQKKSDFHRYCSKEGRSIWNSVRSQKILPNVSALRIKSSLEKIEVISFKEKSGFDKSTDIRDRLLDSATASYIKGKGVKNIDDDVEMVEENVFWYQTVAEYNRKTRENPHEIDVWLEFVDFQDKLAMEQFTDKKITESSIIEKKISIINKAIESNPGNIKLKMKYLDLCKRTMSPEMITKEMEQLLFTHPTNTLLWKQYLLYHQSCVSIFTVSKVCKVYHKCFSKLLGYLEGRLHTHTINKCLHEEVLDLFVQFCYFLKQVGQTEKAVACFQALIEFNLYCPVNLNNIKHEERLVIFESFWDSGVARIGENGAKGWSYWYSNKDAKLEPHPAQPKNTEETEQEIVKQEKIRWKVWMAVEQERQRAHWLPWRPDISQNETEEDCEDLDRLVLFDDICNVLIPVSRSLHFDLIISFLKFLDVNVGPRSILQVYALESLQNVIEHSELDMVKTYVENSEIQQNFTKCLMDQLIDKLEGENKTSLSVYKMYFEYDLCGKDSKLISKCKKLAKAMLKENHNRNNLHVWCAYCDILWKSNSQIEAKSVIETALSMICDNNPNHDRLKLYRMLTELYLGMSLGENDAPQHCNLMKAQNVLICFAEEKNSVKDIIEITPTNVLRTRKKLESLCDTSMDDMSSLDKLNTMSRSDIGYVCETFKLYSLFEYSFGKHEVELATTVLEDAIKHLYQLTVENKMEKRTADKVKHVMEDLFYYSIRLSKHFMTVNTAPLSSLRNIIQHAMKVFPENPYFLQVFINIELRMYISGRLDRYFSHMIRSADSPIPVIFAVYSVLCRQNNIDKQLQNQDDLTVISTGGLINRIRSYIERALDHSSVSQCPLVWRLYLHSEVQYGNLSRAQGIFYRALQSCPWSKALYLDAVALFAGDRVEEIVDLMTEKEIRLQIPLEEVDILLEEIPEDNKDKQMITDS